MIIGLLYVVGGAAIGALTVLVLAATDPEAAPIVIRVALPTSAAGDVA